MQQPRSGSVIAIHGHGDEPSSAARWGGRLAPPGWEVVAPGAPVGRDGVRSWFDTGPRGADPAGLRRAASQIGELIGQLHRSGTPVVVVGFSQGAAVALCLEAAAPGDGERADAVVSVCGFLPDPDLAPADGEGAARVFDAGPSAPPLLLLAGADDDVTPAFLTSDAASVLASGGRDVAAVVLAGGHAVTDDAALRVRSWISERFAPTVRVSLGLPVDRVDAGTELVSGDAIAALAAAYERLGFHAAFVTDHPAPDARWLAGGGHHAMEPTVALATAAAATRRLLLHTNVYVLPYRNPFLAAKALASLDVVSGGRLVVGVAAGYLRPEFRALGMDFEDRTSRLEDALVLLPRIWSEDAFAAAGRGYDAGSVTSEPRPVQRPHPPIWVGGNSRAAMRRAVTLAQGWSPFPTVGGMERAVRTAAIADLGDLRRELSVASEMCEQAGRSEPLTTCFVPFSLAGYLQDPVGGLHPLVEEVAELASMGIDWVALSVPGTTRQQVIDCAGALAASLPLG